MTSSLEVSDLVSSWGRTVVLNGVSLTATSRSTLAVLDRNDDQPWSTSKAKTHFWKCLTIDLIVVSLATYAFDLSMFSLWLFGTVPSVLRKPASEHGTPQPPLGLGPRVLLPSLFDPLLGIARSNS
jgi:hypothetical protein